MTLHDEPCGLFYIYKNNHNLTTFFAIWNKMSRDCWSCCLCRTTFVSTESYWEWTESGSRGDTCLDEAMLGWTAKRTTEFWGDLKNSTQHQQREVSYSMFPQISVTNVSYWSSFCVFSPTVRNSVLAMVCQDRNVMHLNTRSQWERGAVESRDRNCQDHRPVERSHSGMTAFCPVNVREYRTLSHYRSSTVTSQVSRLVTTQLSGWRMLQIWRITVNNPPTSVCMMCVCCHNISCTLGCTHVWCDDFAIKLFAEKLI